MDMQRSSSGPLNPGPGEALTDREIEILELAGRGLSMKGIARVLGIAAGTVSWHLKNAYQKLHVGSREEAVRRARELQLIEAGLLCPHCAGLLAPRH